MKANQEIRDLIAKHRLRNWEVAQELGLSDSRFSIWLRTTLNEERKSRVEKAVNTLIKKEG
ncbi:hypothetical protein [Enterococcus casseliflavus]|uniref:hypothetical protein n=1 Tax=Enterococcus casseliflavus TaxID=37734 RepID=UPI0022DE9A4C|nr:hypothetical protein [Enterococcus casseliflavus]MDV7753368.1 hypothetical protein [Enterococcus casseliflavus]